jgi:hypothetical protein
MTLNPERTINFNAMYTKIKAVLLLCIIIMHAKAQEKPNTTATTPMAPAELPGKGLAQHDFFYSGEGNSLISIVQHGKVVWTYTDTAKRGEVSDAALLANGNVLFAHQFGITAMTKDKKLIWKYEAPPGTEIHTARPIGKDKIVYIQNGNPAKMVVVDMVSGKTLFEKELQTGDPLKVHPQFRHAELTRAGTLLVAHMDLGKVREYDDTGNIIWEVDIQSPWYAERLPNGNTLITSNRNFVREVNSKGETVWEFTTADLPQIKFSGLQKSMRLANGNTLIGNWARKGDSTAVQAVEVSPDKKLVWALRSWNEPDLGRSTTIQVLDKPVANPEKMHFGRFK